jgi:hypothetical protein
MDATLKDSSSTEVLPMEKACSGSSVVPGLMEKTIGRLVGHCVYSMDYQKGVLLFEGGVSAFFSRERSFIYF